MFKVVFSQAQSGDRFSSSDFMASIKERLLALPLSSYSPAE